MVSSSRVSRCCCCCTARTEHPQRAGRTWRVEHRSNAGPPRVEGSKNLFVLLKGFSIRSTNKHAPRPCQQTAKHPPSAHPFLSVIVGESPLPPSPLSPCTSWATRIACTNHAPDVANSRTHPCTHDRALVFFFLALFFRPCGHRIAAPMTALPVHFHAL
jgi:hypothetical protein